MGPVVADVKQQADNGAALAHELQHTLAEHGSALLQYATSLSRSTEAARDAVQEAATRYWLARSTGTEFENPRGWLFRVVRHQLLDQRRREGRLTNLEPEVWASIADVRGNPEELCQRDAMDKAIQSLSPRERACIRHRLNGMSYADIGKAMGVATNTVGVVINRVMRKVQAA